MADARWKRMAAGLLFLLLGVSLVACGGSGGGEEEDPAVKECQDACNKRMRCDAGANITVDVLNNCVAHCADPQHPTTITIEEAHVLCDKEYALCDEFMDCVKRVQDYEQGTTYDPFCQAWCARCKVCMEEDETFTESMCQYAAIDEGKRCLDGCQKRIDGAKDSCVRMFEIFNPETESCENVADNSPFDQGC